MPSWLCRNTSVFIRGMVGSGVASKPGRGRCGVPKIKEAPLPHRKHIISYTPLCPRAISALLQIVQLIAQRTNTAPSSMDRTEFAKFADEFRAMHAGTGARGDRLRLFPGAP
jgi:hypothetical protein